MFNLKNVLVITLIAGCAGLCYGVECKHSNRQVTASQEFSVVGSGDTYQKAFKDAKNRMPAGKSWFKVTSKKSGNTFYVTLYYK